MLRVGLTGGLATGKSFVGRILEDLGCRLLKADALGHEAIEPGGPAFESVLAEFGREMLDETGHIDRRKLAGEVFDKPDRLAALNAIIHPVVIAREEEWMRQVEAANPRTIAIVEAAILIETGSHKRFDKLVLTVCSREQQIERAMKRDKLTREEVLSRLERQMPLDEKRKFADFVIDTSGEKAATERQVEQLYAALQRLTL